MWEPNCHSNWVTLNSLSRKTEAFEILEFLRLASNPMLLETGAEAPALGFSPCRHPSVTPWWAQAHLGAFPPSTALLTAFCHTHTQALWGQSLNFCFCFPRTVLFIDSYGKDLWNQHSTLSHLGVSLLMGFHIPQSPLYYSDNHSSGWDMSWSHNHKHKPPPSSSVPSKGLQFSDNRNSQ